MYNFNESEFKTRKEKIDDLLKEAGRHSIIHTKYASLFKRFRV